MTRRYTYWASLNWGGDIPTAELEVEATYGVAWGDPLSDSEVEDIKVVSIDGQPPADATLYEYLPGETLRQIIDKLQDERADDMIAVAYAADAEDEAGALDRRDEARAEHLREAR